LCEKWDSNKRAPSRTSSADHWDMHKKTRAAESDAESRTSEQEEREINDEQPQAEEAMDHVFSGSSFFASPEPSMLPMPTFFRSRCPSMMFVPAH
jgi:amidophosphoribosyltransferase